MQARWFTVIVVSMLALAACSSDKKKSTPVKDAGTDAAVDSGSVVDVDSGKPAAMTMQCGSNTCTAPAIDTSGLGIPVSADQLAGFGYGPEVCCAGAKKDLCGVTQSMLIPGGACIEQKQKGKADKACPDASTSVMGFITIPLKGCCKPSNQCGVDLGILGVGCLERTEASKLMPVADGGTAMPLQAIGCEYVPSTSDGGTPGTDAGNEDAGN